jgi:hypothetical protein
MGRLVGNVTMNITNWLGQMQQEMDGCLADLAQVSVASERKNYAANLAALQFGVTRLILEHPERLEAKATERAARACFLSAIGKFISFLDKLIASEGVSKDGIFINRNLSIDNFQNYVTEYVEERIAKVAKDTSLTNPKKIECFAAANAMIKDTAVEYFTLRRALEHHQDVPQKELLVHVHRMALVVDDVEITALPHNIHKGQILGVRILREERRYSAGVKITLSPQDAHDLVFTMRNVLAPGIFRAHMEAVRQHRPRLRNLYRAQ